MDANQTSNEQLDPAICGDDGPITPERCALWLDAKYSRHHELEDRAAAMWLRKLSIGNERLQRELRDERQKVFDLRLERGPDDETLLQRLRKHWTSWRSPADEIETLRRLNKRCAAEVLELREQIERLRAQLDGRVSFVSVEHANALQDTIDRQRTALKYIALDNFVVPTGWTWKGEAQRIAAEGLSSARRVMNSDEAVQSDRRRLPNENAARRHRCHA